MWVIDSLDKRTQLLATQVLCEYLAMQVAIGDQHAAARLDTMAKSDVPDTAIRARIAKDLAAWWTGWPNADAQSAAFDDLSAAAATAEPVANEAVVFILASRVMNHDQKRKVNQYAVDHFKSPQLAEERAQARAELARLKLEGQPMKIVGRTVDGKTFDSSQWVGKVIVVDFWATWCPPCRAELPHVIDFYEKYHAKGVEIVGVSCDQQAAELKTFLQSNSGMKWPQLFVPSANGDWHPLARKYGVNSIPTMFIIDKKGVCRTVEGRAEYEKLVPELLKE